MNILFISSEEAPFAKVGGLGEVMYALPRALGALGHDARVMIPRYGTIAPEAYGLSVVRRGLEVPTAPEGGKRLRCNVLSAEHSVDPRRPVTTYFLENREYYEFRSNVYGYIDDRIRFALLSRGALAFLDAWQEWRPEIIVSTDWMTGLVSNFLKTDYADHEWLAAVISVFSIHNLAPQGTPRPHRFLSEMERDDGHGPVPDFFGERMQMINGMRRGIMYADVITTVSERYAEEITTEEFGEGLDALLRERRARLHGILNGIDYEANDPARDPFLAKTFTTRSLAKRLDNKRALQQRLGLPQEPGAFVAGIVSRLTRQKGLALLIPIVDAFLKATKAQLVVVGTGDTELMDFFSALETKFPKQVRAHLQFDNALPHLVYAGADVVIVPSKFEPSGLTQMEAMRFGAIPVVRRVGGLADTVVDYAPGGDRGDGFVFEEFDPNALLIALVRAFVNWRHAATWRKLQQRAMVKDFSWERSARAYAALFAGALAAHGEALKHPPAEPARG